MHFCIDCGKMLPDDFHYALCEGCQESGKCHHGVPYKELCGECDIESDRAFDATRGG